MLEVVTREDAIKLGLKRYFHGRPCKKGHISERVTNSEHCVECKQLRYLYNREANLATSARYRKDNPEKCRELCSNWRKNNKERIDKYNANYYYDNIEYNKRRRSIYRQEHLEEDKKSNVIWRAENPEKSKQATENWRKAHPENIRVYSRNRKARKRGNGGRHTRRDIDALFVEQDNKCAHPWCNKDMSAGYHVDHIIPLVAGGRNDKQNLQLLCPSCNLSKNDIHPIINAAKHGYLLTLACGAPPVYTKIEET